MEVPDIVMDGYQRAFEIVFKAESYFGQFADKLHLIDRDVDEIRIGDAIAIQEDTICVNEYGRIVDVSTIDKMSSFEKISMPLAYRVARDAARKLDSEVRGLLDGIGKADPRCLLPGFTREDAGVFSAFTLERIKGLFEANQLLLRLSIGKPNFVVIMSPVIAVDLRDRLEGDWEWQPLDDYYEKDKIFMGETGRFGCCSVIEDENCSIGEDTYVNYFFAGNPVEYVETVAPSFRVTGPFDSAGRTLNVGWYAIRGYGCNHSEMFIRACSTVQDEVCVGEGEAK